VKKPRLKKILFVLLALLLLYVLWLGYHLLRFQPRKGDLSKASELEIQGAYHIHSVHSDGRKTIDEISELASQAALDFIIITDHGNPNKESLAEQGWKAGVLVLVGSELSTNRGHLVALGFNPPDQPFSRVAERAVEEITAAGGMSIIAHPDSKVRWTWGPQVEYSGIEILNSYSPPQKNFVSMIPYLPLLLVRPHYWLLKILDAPVNNLKRWDELNTTHPVHGFFAIDAHLLYRPLLTFFHLHLRLRQPLSPSFEEAREQVNSVLKKGRFYCAIEAAAEARGFRFWAETEEGNIPMGSRTQFRSPLRLRIKAPFPFAKEIHLIHDGKKILSSNQKNISYEVTEPGIYRVEVYLRERSPLGKNVPWIISNSILLRRDQP